MQVLEDGHIIVKCCKCSEKRTMHGYHMPHKKLADPNGNTWCTGE
jgi:hypothetical protein